jgi:hypothetical protein
LGCNDIGELFCMEVNGKEVAWINSMTRQDTFTVYDLFVDTTSCPVRLENDLRVYMLNSNTWNAVNVEGTKISEFLSMLTKKNYLNKNRIMKR